MSIVYLSVQYGLSTNIFQGKDAGYVFLLHADNALKVLDHMRDKGFL
jgi:hypothetical protein